MMEAGFSPMWKVRAVWMQAHYTHSSEPVNHVGIGCAICMPWWCPQLLWNTRASLCKLIIGLVFFDQVVMAVLEQGF